MIITISIIGLLISGSLAWFFEGIKANSARWIAIYAVFGFFVFFVTSIISSPLNFNELTLLTRLPWIDSFHIEYAIALDYLSITLILLTFF
tara:strand:- start:401 stop:673 length:273 start_codon:yes stop_codon:yes gene_type:complete